MNVDLNNNPGINIIAKIVLVVFALVFVILAFFGLRFYLADMDYQKALAGSNREDSINEFEKAIRLNPYRAEYKISLARVILKEVSSELAKPRDEQDIGKIQEMVDSAISEAKQASQISSNNVAAQETLGSVYRDIRFLAQGAEVWAVKVFEKAVSLEPTNPVLAVELGKAYLYLAESGSSISKETDEENFDQAINQFNRAITLKGDYWDAYRQLSIGFEIKGETEEVIKRLEELDKQSLISDPNFAEVIFQLGRLYYNTGRTDEAISQFQQVIMFFPNHSNAHYSLGVVYAKQGKRDEALKEFEKVLELNPESEDVKGKIEELR